jgi:hypothetical protein
MARLWRGLARCRGGVAGCRFLEPVGRPGPGRDGFGARAGDGVVARMFRNPRRTLAGVSLLAGKGFSHGRRRSAAKGRASRSWACTAMTIQVQRSAASGSRSLGAVHPGVCLNRRNVCSMSNRRRNACQQRSTSASEASGSGPPQPDWFRVAAAGQVVDLEPDHGTFDDRQWSLVVDPCRSPCQPWMQPIPGPCGRGAVEAGVGDRRRLPGGSGGGVAEDELAAVLGSVTHQQRGPTGHQRRGSATNPRARSAAGRNRSGRQFTAS